MELIATLMGFLQRKFYQGPGGDRRFKQEHSRILAWVVLWPAKWFDERGVTVTADKYRQTFFKVFMDADANRADRIKYLPAWLAKVIQSHFAIHGEEYYEEAKSIRTLAENALLLAHKSPVCAPDPVRELASAARLLKPHKRSRKTAVKGAINLELKLS
jgi:hypothetical protein